MTGKIGLVRGGDLYFSEADNLVVAFPVCRNDSFRRNNNLLLRLSKFNSVNSTCESLHAFPYVSV